MSIPQTVTEVLRKHVTLEVESIDRMYLNVYVPQLQHERGVVAYFRYHRGATFASSALMAPISEAFVAAIGAFAREHEIPVVTFHKGERKDEIAQAHLARLAHTGQALGRQGIAATPSQFPNQVSDHRLAAHEVGGHGGDTGVEEILLLHLGIDFYCADVYRRISSG